MAKESTAKNKQEEQAVEETKDELQEVKEVAPEVDLPDEAAGAKTEAESSDDAKQDAEAKLTKAGKHSAKAVRESEAEAERLERKEHRAEAEAEAEAAPKAPKRQQPNPLHQHGKKYREAVKLIDKQKAYSLEEALTLAKQTSTSKFDGSVELHINLGVDPRQADQMVRSSVVLPNGTGKTVRVAVFADGKAADAAKEAGADLVGTDSLLKDIEKGKLAFDMLVATPDKMVTLGKVAKVLGPRGLMPNPKSGTVTPDVAKAVKEAKAGKVEFRIDKQAIVHQGIGKVSFADDKLLENATTFLTAVLKSRPAAAKGTYMKAITATTSMGPSVRVDAQSTVASLSTTRK